MSTRPPHPNPLGALRAECSALLRDALASIWPEAVGRGFRVFLPSRLEFGDLATNACFELARDIGRSPLELASELAAKMDELLAQRPGLVERVEAVAGYLNFWADLPRLAELAINSARELGDRYGYLPAEQPLRVVVEHTSANPVHPMHIGHGRNSVLGDALARLLRARGHRVITRFYVNDVGRQVAILAYGYDRLGRPELEGKPDHTSSASSTP